ncbi:AraC family transcriptional regulator [Chitinophaga sp. SYP-B3965]|uniref:helix-turn-helix transcriptional regulator n=1 Tax=Chitinophaga sp. SYP-B3965 TaxID=2663120 RepID=UPI001563CA2A|nr:AraC family transcriptional regulator [Chitinophaga sp. SYP-B3965]
MSNTMRPEILYIDDRGAEAHITMMELQWKNAHVFSTQSRQKKPVRYVEQVNKPTVGMYFSLEGVSGAYPSDGESMRLTSNQHVMGYQPHFDGYYLIEAPFNHNLGIELEQPFFERLLSNELDCLQRFADKMHKGQAVGLSPYPLPISSRQKAILLDLFNCNYSGHMQELYFEARIMELFLLQAEQAESYMGRKPLLIKPADVDKLHNARQFVKLNMFESISLQQVARAAGLNDFKLKKGFKELFGTTVFGYLNELKMNHAKRLLLDGGITIGDLAFDLGYSEAQNFTKAFKRHFGYPPGELKS